jgi:uncharacterized protein (TIGR02145 family)
MVKISFTYALAVAAAIIFAGCSDNWISGGESAGVGEFLEWFKENPDDGTKYTLTTDVNPSNAGTVTRSPDEASYISGKPVNITAEPYSSHLFVNWTITNGIAAFANANSAATTVTMNSDATIRANFKINHFNPSINYGSFTDQRDGKSYRTVTIGGQTWMAENLNYDIGDSQCHNNIPNNCNIYGRLYHWDTAWESCPDGWHLSSVDEWKILIDNVGGDSELIDQYGHNSFAASKLRAKFLWSSTSAHDNYTDDSGFSALPGGFGPVSNSLGSHGYWWTATDYGDDGDGVWFMVIQSIMSKGGTSKTYRTEMHSVRCVQN